MKELSNQIPSLFWIQTYFSELKAPAFLLRNVGVSTLLLLFSCRSARPFLFEELFKFVLGMDMDPFSWISAGSHTVSMISELENPVSFKASTLSRKLAIIHFLKPKRFRHRASGLWRNQNRIYIIKVESNDESYISITFVEITLSLPQC